ncbi:MAG: B12-binding domain-containing radical SAM protein [Candidatus Hermodarchaeota archaeon]
MWILFIYSLNIVYSQNPLRPLESLERLQFGISYISAFLKSHGYRTELLVLTRETKNEYISDFIIDFHPNLICFTTVTTEYNFIAKIAQYIKARFPNIYLLVGGPHVSLNPESAIKDSFDALCIGEGEYPTLELIEQLKEGRKPTSIPNLWIKRDNQIEKNPTREFIHNLDNLPFPDREMWLRWINYPHNRRQVILLARGCPFNCSYCCNHALKRLAPGKYVRLRSVENIIEELKAVIKRFPQTKEIYFEIETIGVNLEFAIDLCSKLEKINKKLKRPLSFGANLRITPKKNFEPLFAALKKANFRFVNIGLESGSEKIRKEILRRNYSNKDFLRIVQLMKSYDLKFSTYNMIGIPGETLSDFKMTIACNRTALPNWMNVNIFFPYPGTDLYAVCKELGLLNHRLDERERVKASLDLKQFSRKQVQKQFEWFYYNVYRGYKPLYLALGMVFYIKMRNIVVLNRIYCKLTSYPFLKKIERLFDISKPVSKLFQS